MAPPTFVTALKLNCYREVVRGRPGVGHSFGSSRLVQTSINEWIKVVLVSLNKNAVGTLNGFSLLELSPLVV